MRGSVRTCRPPPVRNPALSDRRGIFIAARRTEAQHVEEVLTRLRIDYAVEIAPYATSILGLFPTQYRGAHFTVMAGQAGDCRQARHRAGVTQGVVEED